MNTLYSTKNHSKRFYLKKLYRTKYELDVVKELLKNARTEKRKNNLNNRKELLKLEEEKLKLLV